VPISEEAIGALRLDEPLGALERTCPFARDTSIVNSVQADGRTSRYPGVSFPFENMSVLALQYGVDRLDLNRPADGWILTGAGGVLPRNVPTSSTWALLYSRYGPAQANSGRMVLTRFCALPRILFTMNVDGAFTDHSSEQAIPRVGDQGSNDVLDLRMIPGSATIHHLFIMSRPLAASFTPCR
jgi:hypothetical protein